MLTNPFPQQGVVSQPQQGQVAHPPQPYYPSDYQILMMNFVKVNTSDINFQTRSHQYGKPFYLSATETKSKVFTEPLTTPNCSL